MDNQVYDGEGNAVGVRVIPPETASRIAELEAKLATAVGALEEADQRLSRPDWTVQRDKTRMSIRSSLASIQERT